MRGDTPDSCDVLSDTSSIKTGPSGADDHDSEIRFASDSENQRHADQKDEEENVDDSQFDSFSPPEYEAGSISFGALARAQASLLGASSKKRKRPSFDANTMHVSSHRTGVTNHSAEALERKAGKRDDRKHTRLSKHAPAELSSKKAVSRKRSVVPVPKREIRDPRFESALGPINEQKLKSNYAFLDEYRDSERKTLKAEIKKTKSKEEKERLKKEVLRMESRKKAQQRKDAEQEVLRRHRKEERAKVESGKAPFYLKRAEVKKEALIKRYRQMKGREVDKLVEKRRKKMAGQEKRDMPRQRRSSVK